MVTQHEIRQFAGQRVTLQLAPQAPGGPTLTGRIVGVLDALDGLVVTVEPEGAPSGTRLTVHYHHIIAVTPARSGV